MAFKKKSKEDSSKTVTAALPSVTKTLGKVPCFAKCLGTYTRQRPMFCRVPSPSTRQSSFLVDNKGHLPSAMVNALGKGSFCRVLHTANCLIFFYFIVWPELEHGDDYCTSWYEMKEVLRRRFSPSSGSSYMVAYEFFCAIEFEKNASTNHPAITGCIVIFLQPHPLLE